ncbi:MULTISPECIES: hypothetical protein [unclassified Enterococcus]|nr:MULTISPECIES: hypothetical protein [unclassified Enterococcus]
MLDEKLTLTVSPTFISALGVELACSPSLTAGVSVAGVFATP